MCTALAYTRPPVIQKRKVSQDAAPVNMRGEGQVCLPCKVNRLPLLALSVTHAHIHSHTHRAGKMPTQDSPGSQEKVERSSIYGQTSKGECLGKWCHGQGAGCQLCLVPGLRKQPAAPVQGSSSAVVIKLNDRTKPKVADSSLIVRDSRVCHGGNYTPFHWLSNLQWLEKQSN